ncbi:MAG: leucine-rich repeat protein [Treponema sp.]|nr:leucine-rich repeat protein [Treponema sp.]
MRHKVKAIALFALAMIAAFAFFCASCSRVSEEYLLENKEIPFNVTERFEWIEYLRHNEDTLNSISNEFNISLRAIFAGNESVWGEDELRIPNMEGIGHTVVQGDTVSSLSRRYNVPQEIIINVNEIIDDTLNEGKWLFIPRAFIFSNFTNTVHLKERFIYPVKGAISRNFGWHIDELSDAYNYHPGITIKIDTDTPVRATMSGVVEYTGIDPLHGKFVVIRHHFAYFSIYAHLSHIEVQKGSYVRQGNIIGRIDYITEIAPLLFFSIFRGVDAINPENLIRESKDYAFDDINGFIIQTIDDDTAIRIISYMGNNRVAIIPYLINNLPVTEIGDKAFFEKGITGVTIPDSVTYIGKSSFNTNRLNRINIPDSVNVIDYMAFADNRLTRVIVPNSVSIIGKYAFYRNKISRVTIPDSVTTIGGGAFISNRLTRVTIPNSLTVIEGSVFSENRLRKIVIPDSITSIGGRAFSGNALREIIIPDSVSSIGNNAFRGRITGRRRTIREFLMGHNIECLMSSLSADNASFENIEYSGNKAKRITINANVTLSDSFELGFDDFYLENGSKAGVFSYSSGLWKMIGGD